jgi:hypothetical protein
MHARPLCFVAQTTRQMLAEFNCGWDPSNITRISDVAQEEMYHFCANFAKYG